MFEDRREAGRELAESLADYRRRAAVVLALPRGGVVVGYEVSVALRLPLDVLVTRKLRAPEEPELAIGAVAEDGSVEVDQEAISLLGVSEAYLRQEIDAQLAEAQRRVWLYRGNRPLPLLKGKEVLLIDDGVATGYTALVGLRAARALGPERLVVAAPVIAANTASRLAAAADTVVCLAEPSDFFAVGQFYGDFSQVSDAEVLHLLEAAQLALAPP